MGKFSAWIFCCLAALSFASHANAQTLYGATSASGPGELYILNAATGGMIQDVGPLNDPSATNYPITGLAFNPITGILYGSTGNSVLATAAKLVTINPATGLVTVVGAFNAGPVNSTGTPSTMADIAFDSAGNLFGVGSIGGPQLYSINIGTGQATVIGSTGLTATSGGGLAISPTDVFYGTPTSSRFGTYNSGTGAYTNITNPTKPVGGAYAALAFNGSVLYGLDLGPGPTQATHLVTIDPATGTVTDIGASVNLLDSIAFQVVPEPGAVSMFVIGGSLLGVAASKRRRTRS
jgi:uncharacterized protein DUF6923